VPSYLVYVFKLVENILTLIKDKLGQQNTILTSGQTLVEYAMIIGLTAIILLVSLGLLGETLNNFLIGNVVNALEDL